MKTLLFITLLVFSVTLPAAELKNVGSLSFENSGAKAYRLWRLWTGHVKLDSRTDSEAGG